MENQSPCIILTENSFKNRFYKHKNSFKYDSKCDATNCPIKYERINAKI